MSEPQVIKCDIVTASGGGQTITTPRVSGRVLSIRYVNHATVLADNWTLDIVGATTGILVLDQGATPGATPFTICPRQAAHSTVSAALVYTADDEPVTDYIWVNEALTVIIAAGGNTKQGTLYITVG